jgi:hypothetical protein
MVTAPPPSSLGGGRTSDRDAIFGGPMSPPQRSPILPEASESSADKKLIDGSEEFIEIKVLEPRKIGDGMSSYLVYKVVTKTNASYFKKKEFFVIRRFSDFLGLYQKLTEKYLQVGSWR